MKLPMISIGVLIITFLFCSKKDVEPPIEVVLTVSNIVVEDVDDQGNGSDIKVSFMGSEIPAVREYRIFLVRKESAANFDLPAAASISSNRYSVIPADDLDVCTLLPATTVDIVGHGLQNQISYELFVMTVSNDINGNFVNGLSLGVDITLSFSSATNHVLTLAGGFDGSGGVLVGPEGDLFIADFGTGAENGTRLLKFTQDVKYFETFARGLLGPTGGAFNSQGELFWSSYSASTIHKISSGGSITDFAEVPGPVALTFDENDNLFVASCDANEIKKISPAGEVTTFASSDLFNCPNGLVFGEDSELYGCNFEDGLIYRISILGEVERFAQIPANSSVNLAYKDPFLYLTARNAHQIYRINTDDKQVNLFAGTGERGTQNGRLLESTFSFPNGLAWSSDGKILYVNDVDPNAGFNDNGFNFNPNILRALVIEE